MGREEEDAVDDKKIVELYFARSESAIRESQKKYGKYCFSIAYRILFSKEDSEECVNDTYQKAWSAIPPHRPLRLSTFLGKITRNLALDRYAYCKAEKRCDNTALVYEEISECIPHPVDGRSMADEIALKNALSGFLGMLNKSERMIFMRRYWYLSSVKEIASDFSMTESNVKVILHRTRKKLKDHLEKEGIEIE